VNTRNLVFALALFILVLSPRAFANGVADPPTHGLGPTVLIGLAIMLVASKLAGELFERIGQSTVLGELTAGVILGNLALLGFDRLEPLKTNEIVAALAEIGVIFLLFEVGLESDLKEMLEVGWSSLLVAVLGVVAPFFLGLGVAAYFIPTEAPLTHVFIGAILCATSVGITARVFKDLNVLTAAEARIVLGAAVIDDVLGLLILTVVAGAIQAATVGGALSVAGIATIAGKALAFLIAAIIVGHFVVPHLLRGSARLTTRGVLLTMAVAFCLALSWAASKVGLAPIVGAFAAGLVLDEVHYKQANERHERDLQELLQPVSTFLVPIFFVLMGLKVDLSLFARTELLGFALVLTVAAVLGKQVCALGVLRRGVSRLTVGLGMIPRGEVGLIFAGIGASLMLPNAQGQVQPVVGSGTFGAVVIMVLVTTLITPPALKWALSRPKK
jgi:Kef-type K+ transport system membrane component KefB